LTQPTTKSDRCRRRRFSGFAVACGIVHALEIIDFS